MIKMAIRLDNDMVMAFDGDGEQLPEYQGSYADVRDSIVRDAPVDTLFAHWTKRAGRPSTVTREEW